jgi:hypothetical protein
MWKNMYKILDRINTGQCPILLLLLLLWAHMSNAQQASQGNTTIYNGAEMTLFGNYEFATGGAGIQPGIVATLRTAPYGVLKFANANLLVTGANHANHIDGYVSNLGNGKFIYPVGDNGNYAPFAATAANTVGAYFLADPNVAVTSMVSGEDYVALPAGAPFNTANLSAKMTAVSAKEYWDINGSEATAITLTWNDASDIEGLTSDNLQNLSIAGWNASTSKWEFIASVVDGTSLLGATSSLTSGSITTITDIIPDTYSVYTFASGASMLPNLATTVDIDNQNFTLGQSRDFVVYLFETNGAETSGTVMLRIARQSGWDFTVPGITLSGTDQSGISGNVAVGGGTPHENGNWLFKQNTGFITVTLKPGSTIPMNGMSSIGLKATVKAGTSPKTAQNLSIAIVDGSGGEIDSSDNLYITTITAN